ncbi:MAG: hypothetical protein MK212_05540 [Saprospiraceae bacterium]|nr:hypothetical protein [Saprospiraceae bacterium]
MSSIQELKEVFRLVQALQTAKDVLVEINFHNLTIHYEHYLDSLADLYLACQEIERLQTDIMAKRYLFVIETALNELIYQQTITLPQRFFSYQKQYLGVCFFTLLTSCIIASILLSSQVKVMIVICMLISVYFVGTRLMYKGYEKRYITQKIPELITKVKDLHKVIDKLEFLLESYID